ncbi:MAG: AraC family transcriptional regulator, partial [Paludibacteraceae bacterium]|nr:AraC family transcriptional regulator [Paludibacteraceae bacterium]
MEDIIYFNISRDGKDLNDYKGVFNIFMLCNKNRVTFHQGNVRYTADSGDFVVWLSTKPCDRIDYSDQTDADVLLVSDYFLDLYRPNQVSDARGYEYQTINPILRSSLTLLARERTILEDDFKNILRHSYTFQGYLGEQIAGTLLRVLLYDLWTFFSQLAMKYQDEGLPSPHFARFLLEARYNCSKHRDVAWYANKIGVTPKYLTEISKDATNRPAGDWIDEYAAIILRKELSAENLSLTDLAKEMNFSSLPAFTRYVKRVLGCSPSEFRDSLKKKYV